MLIVFVLSFMALAARIIYVSFYADRDTTVIVPDNMLKSDYNEDGIPADPVITPGHCEKEPSANALAGILCERNAKPAYTLLSAGSTQATVVELYLGQNADNDAFRAQNMFPGDQVTKFYCLKVYHKADIAVYFNVTDIIETRSLGDILHIKVTRFNEDGSGEQVVCDGSFSNIKNNTYHTVFTTDADRETIACYKIEVSLPSSASNEYQGASLSAQFNWYAENPAPPPPHACENKCPTCGKCLDKLCTESVCSEKCPGHGGIPGIHECDNKCDVCGGCKDTECPSEVCSPKCDCSPLISKPSKRYLIWPWTILPALSFTSLIILIIVFFRKKKKEDDNDQ